MRTVWVVAVVLPLLDGCRETRSQRNAPIVFRGAVAPFALGKWRSLANCVPAAASNRLHCAFEPLAGTTVIAIDVGPDSTLISQLVTRYLNAADAGPAFADRRAFLERMLGPARVCAANHLLWDAKPAVRAGLAMTDESVTRLPRPRVLVADWVGLDSIPSLFACSESRR